MSKVKIPFLYLVSFILSVLPVSIYFFINGEKYFVTVPERVKLTTGGLMLLIIVVLKVTGKLKMPSRTSVFGIVFILCYLLGNLLEDMLVLSFLALVGEIMDSICQVLIKRAKAQALTDKAAKQTAEEIKKVLNGRV